MQVISTNAISPKNLVESFRLKKLGEMTKHVRRNGIRRSGNIIMWGICGVCTLVLTVAKTSSHYDRSSSTSLSKMGIYAAPRGRRALEEMGTLPNAISTKNLVESFRLKKLGEMTKHVRRNDFRRNGNRRNDHFSLKCIY